MWSWIVSSGLKAHIVKGCRMEKEFRIRKWIVVAGTIILLAFLAIPLAAGCSNPKTLPEDDPNEVIGGPVGYDWMIPDNNIYESVANYISSVPLWMADENITSEDNPVPPPTQPEGPPTTTTTEGPPTEQQHQEPDTTTQPPPQPETPRGTTIIYTCYCEACGQYWDAYESELGAWSIENGGYFNGCLICGEGPWVIYASREE
jgi:hypothetical protein